MRALGICAEQAGTRLSHARSHCQASGTSSTADSVSASLAIGPWPAIIAHCFRACKRAVHRLQAQRRCVMMRGRGAKCKANFNDTVFETNFPAKQVAEVYTSRHGALTSY